MKIDQNLKILIALSFILPIMIVVIGARFMHQLEASMALIIWINPVNSL